MNDLIAPPPPEIVRTSIEDSRESAADIRSIFGVLLRNWKVVVAVPLIATALTYGALKLIPPQYKSTVGILVIDPKRPKNAADEKQISYLDVNQSAMESETAIIESKALALRVVNELGFDKDPEFLQSPFQAIVRNIGLASPDWIRSTLRVIGFFTPSELKPNADAAAGELVQNHLTIEREGFSYVLNITGLSTDAAKAQRIAAAVANAYLNDQLEARYTAAQSATTWLTGRLDELRARVVETEATMEKLKAENGLIDTGTSGNISQQQTSELSAQLALARSDVVEKRARYNQARRIVDSNGDIQTIPEVLASPVVTQLRAQQAEISRREADLRSRFGERYPEVLNIRAQLSDVNKAIAAEVNRILDNLKNAYDIAQQREQSIESSLQRLTEQRGNSPAVIKLRELQRVDDADRKIYENFLALFNEIQQRATLNEADARIINPATLPGAPSYPRRARIYLIVFGISTIIGIALAFVREHLDVGFKTSMQVEQALNLPVLGLIPSIPKPELQKHLRHMPGKSRRTSYPFSRLSEVVRGLRTSIMLSERKSAPKLILVTSSIPDEGKSTAAMLLAMSSVQAEQRTLLIDCDLRRKTVSAAFGLQDKPGLAEILSGLVNSSDAIFAHHETGVAVIGAGSGAINSADLLNSQRMRDLLAELSERYEYIVLDGSPLLPVIDAAILAKMVDKILVAVQWRRTPRMSVLEAIKLLPAETRRGIGIVLTKVDYARLQSYGYGFGHGYNYGHYYRDLERYYRKS